jgi:tripartite-type tricarboxylate transporter receptor subunit TctC
MKDIPFSGTLAEGLEYESWLGLIAPKGLPPDVLDRLSTAIRESVSSPEFAAKMTPLGATARVSAPAAFRARVERDIAHFKRIVAARSIAPE